MRGKRYNATYLSLVAGEKARGTPKPSSTPSLFGADRQYVRISRGRRVETPPPLNMSDVMTIPSDYFDASFRAEGNERRQSTNMNKCALKKSAASSSV